MSALFGDRLASAVRAAGAPVAVGIDPHLDRLPRALRRAFEGRSGAAFRVAAGDAVAAFSRIVVGAVRGRVAAVKPQVAFFEQLGAPGWAALEETCRAARDAGLLVVADAKRGDIASTARAYAAAALDPDGPLGADALTVNPWLGPDTLEPYLPWCREAGRGLFVLLRTSNPESARYQLAGDPPVARLLADDLRRIGAGLVGESGLSSVGAVVASGAAGARVRAWLPDAWFLVPGVGAQGGTAEQALAGARPDGLGALVVAARSVTFPPEGAARDEYDDDPGAWMARQTAALAAAAEPCRKS